jgi:electron-transferring-flavoprotein dehydrogenase
MYHLENNQVYVGFIIDLNYKNPHLFPYMEFQRFKHHPRIAKVLGGRQAGGLWRACRSPKGDFNLCRKRPFRVGAMLGCSVRAGEPAAY